jgi:hypothetical protein
VGPVLVIELLELPERVQQVALVPDERAVQEFAAAGLSAQRSMTEFILGIWTR